MIEVAKDTELERKIDSLVRQAWEFGVACEIDDVNHIGAAGDSHIEFLRDKLDQAKDELYILIQKEMKWLRLNI